MLSIGAGGDVGKMLKFHAQQRGFYLTEIDIDSERMPDVVGDICQWESNTLFNHVYMIEVLEHTKNPFTALENVYTLLDNNGKLVLSTPFMFPLHDEPHDYFRFTKYGLEVLLYKYSKIHIEVKDSWGISLLILLSRTWRTKNKRLNNFSLVYLIVVIVSYPFFFLSSKLFPSDFITSGYLVTAEKNRISQE